MRVEAKDHRPAVRGRETGFTLVELLVSIAMFSVLSVAMASAVLIASRAIGKGDNSASRSVEAADAVAQMEGELRLATSFSERGTNAVTFNIPDRTGDGAEESIRYAWSGIAGEPLTRVYNDGTPEVVAEDVRAFDLAYLVQSIEPASGEGVAGEEVLLLSHVDAPGGQMRSFTIDWEDWCGQYVLPSLPANAIGWKVTRVQFMARRDRTPADGVLSVYVTAATEQGKPSYPVLHEAVVTESSLGAQMAWAEAPITGMADLGPSQGVCILVAYKSGTGDVGVVQYEERGNPMTPDTHWMTTNNRGYTFSTPNSTQDMVIRVYGTVTTPRSGR